MDYGQIFFTHRYLKTFSSWPRHSHELPNREAPCSSDFLVFEGLSLTQTGRITKNIYTNREAKKETKNKVCKVTQRNPPVAGNCHYIDMGKDANKESDCPNISETKGRARNKTLFLAPYVSTKPHFKTLKKYSQQA